MAEIKKVCECCGKEFIAKSNKAKYCSSYCRGKVNGQKRAKLDNKNAVVKNCLYCGKEFIGHYNRKYCCKECQDAVENKKARDLHIQQREQNLSKNAILGYDYVVCPICGQKFQQITSTHFKIHGYNNIDEVYRDYPDLQVTCNKFIENHLKGENNPMSSRNKSELERKQASPYSLEHYYKKGAKTVEDAILMRKQFLDTLDRSTWIQSTNIEYYTRQGYSLDEAQQIIKKKYSRNGLSYYLKKYGEEGKQLYADRISSWHRKVMNGSSHSVAADNFFSQLYTKIKHISNDVYFGNNEKSILCNNKLYYPDFLIYSKKKIIEFFGDYWNCNPNIYESTFYNKVLQKSANDVWKHDNERIHNIISEGYDVLIIWENEIIENFNDCMEKCIEFINN